MDGPYIVIGGGIIGTSIAGEIAKRKLGEVFIMEKEDELGKHASGRNSGVIHSGINQKPGSMKAEFCVRGSRMLREYCEEYEVSMEECGTLVVALDGKDMMKLRTLYEMGLQAGVPGLRIIDEEELREREPHARGLEALFSPTGAIVDSNELLRSLANQAWANGVEYNMGVEVKDISGNVVITNKFDSDAKHIINCAGLNADRIAHMMGVGLEYTILPFRGDYLEVPAKVNSMIYQVPDLRFPFLGVHLTKTLEGNVIAGPTATLSLGGREDYNKTRGNRGLIEMTKDRGFWFWALRSLTNPATVRQVKYNLRLSSSDNEFVNEVKKIYNGDITNWDVKPYRAGIRAQLIDRGGKMVNDFLVLQDKNSTHVLNAVSPGKTSSLAFAEYVVDKYIPKK